MVAEGFPTRGATEKDLIEDPETGAQYVAKLGRRNNDLEVVTEYLIYLVGRNLGAKTADARIGFFRGQLRFLSRYFLDARLQLAHGVELFRELVDDVDQVLDDVRREQQLFTVQAVRDALGAHFQASEELFRSFLHMLVHDAIIGVQDRHHENWGVITGRERDMSPRFAPLYDSARGLLGTMTDDQLRRQFASSKGSGNLDLYVGRSRPLIGCIGVKPINSKHLTHIELMRAVYWLFPESRSILIGMLGRYDWKALDHELRQLEPLVGPFRRALILTCLRRRIRRIRSAINLGPCPAEN
jgi:hypothetical protein